jgi:hypothetical protein
MRKIERQVKRSAMQKQSELNRRSDRSEEPKSLSQAHPKMKYKGGELLIVSLQALIMWPNDES